MPKYRATSEYYLAVGHSPQQHPKDYASFDVVPASGALGAEVLGLDVRGMDQAGFAEFETALTDNLVLFVRDQDLDPEELRRFAKRFGKPVSYPTSVPMPGYPEVTEFRSEPDTVYNFGGSWKRLRSARNLSTRKSKNSRTRATCLTSG